jgi:hypothetical protein
MSVVQSYSSPLTTGQLRHLLLKDLNIVAGSKQLLPKFHQKVYRTAHADMNPMFDMEMRDVTWGEQTGEAADAPIATSGEGIVTSYPINTYTNACFVTLQAQQDNLYKAQWSAQRNGFVDSHEVLENIVLWNQFNNARNNASALGDGLPLLSTAHILAEGTYANTYPIPVGLSKGNLQTAVTAIQLFKSFSMYPKNLRAKWLMVPMQLTPLAQTILFSPDDPNTANRAINAIYHGGYFSEGIIGNPYLNDPSCFFAGTNEDLGFVQYTKMPLTIEALPITLAFVFGYVSAARWGQGCGSGRAVFGSTTFN